MKAIIPYIIIAIISACVAGMFFGLFIWKSYDVKTLDYDAIEIIPYNIAGTEQYIYTVRKTWVFTELEDAETFRREQTGEDE